MPATSLLLIDGENESREATSQLLERHGYTVRPARSGQQAIAAVSRDDDIALVVSEIDLPGDLDGPETANRILAVRPLPCLFLTARADHDTVDRTRAVEHYGYVVKQAGEHVIVESIRTALRLFGSVSTETGIHAPAPQDSVTDRLRRYEQIIEHTSELVSETDEDDLLTFVNTQHERALGYAPEELLGSSPALLLHPDDLQRAVGKHDQIRKAESPSVDVWRFRHKDGSYRTFECRAAVVRDQDGRKRTITVSHDITDRIAAEQAAHESEARFRAFMEHLPAAVFIKNSRNEILFCNQTYASLLETTPETLLNQNPNDAIDPELRAQFETENAQVIAQRQIMRTESAFPFRGRHTHWLTYKFPITVGEETLLGAIGFDITKRKENEEALRLALQEKEHLMDELNHRVKNNLSMVASLVALKDRDIGDAADLTDIRSRISAILAVHERLQQTGDATHIRLRDYVYELVHGLFPPSQGNRVSIDIDVEDLRLHARTAGSVGLIINELATNAVKHGFAGASGRFAVSFHADAQSKEYVLSVSNDGRPFPPEVDMGNPHSLGLRLVTALVTQLEGSLELERSPHPVFTVRFPVGPSLSRT